MAKITFFDAFAGNTLDLTKWTPGLPGDPQGATWGSSDMWFPQNAVVSDNLYLVCNNNTVANGYPSGSLAAKYACALITTYGKFSYTGGWLKARLLMPNSGPGFWPAFWLLPDSYPNSGTIQNWELDFEYLTNANTVYCTAHRGGSQIAQWTVGSTQLSNNYHDYTFYYRPGQYLQFWFDGALVGQLTGAGAPNEPLFPLLNIDTGGWNGNAISGASRFPAVMTCSHVMSWTE